VTFRDVDDAVIEEPAGALIRITAGAICGTDLQTHDGRARAGPGLVLGYEPLGMVEATGGSCSPTRPCWKGTWEVDMADRVPERLDLAGELGAVPVDCAAGDPVEQVRDLRARAGQPQGMKMGRADRETDAGFQGADREHRGQERPSQVISGRARLAGPTGRLRIAGVTRNVVSIRPRMAMWTVTAGRVGPPCSRRGPGRLRPHLGPAVYRQAAEDDCAGVGAALGGSSVSSGVSTTRQAPRAVRPADRRSDQCIAHSAVMPGESFDPADSARRPGWQGSRAARSRLRKQRAS
jgi:hypothetical protein